ncbi:hypothetical protein EG329_011142 [Mollisiaceae sp. DMI_Dod_QoI]|nr:hypothetical protein EG329_011142 [Helotiales sp. DMI_Dod_QoI]
MPFNIQEINIFIALVMYWVIVGFISDQVYQYLGVSETKRVEYAMVMAGLGLLYTFVLGLVALEV